MLLASRVWHAVLLAAVVAAVVLELVVLFGGGADPNSGRTSAGLSVMGKLVRLISFFTIDSNILVGATSVLLIMNPVRDGRLWRILRMDALLSIAITGLVFAVILAPKVHLHGVALAATILLHYIVPPAAVVGWVLFGPWGQMDRRTVLWAFVWPALWIGYTLAHGAVTDWYPYPFLEVFRLGYAVVARNTVLVLVVAVAVALLLMWVDGLLVSRQARSSARPDREDARQ